MPARTDSEKRRVDIYVCPECGKHVPGDQMVDRPMLMPATIRSNPHDGTKVEKLGPRVCQECRYSLDTQKRR